MWILFARVLLLWLHRPNIHNTIIKKKIRTRQGNSCWDEIIRNWLWCFFETKEHKNDCGKSHVILSEVSRRGRAQQGIFSSRTRHGCSCVRSESQIFSLRPHQIQSPSIYPMTSKSLKFRNDAWTWIGCDYIISRPLTRKLEHDETFSFMSSSQQWKFLIHRLTRLIFPFLFYSTPIEFSFLENV